jgi:hypothetical protein
VYTTSSATLKGTILANEAPGTNCSVGGTGAISDGLHNLDADGTCGVGAATDPKLDQAGLRDNGGPTFTIALQPDSPARDAIPSDRCTDQNGAPLTTDQRSITRPQGSACDIGAYEFQPPDTISPKISCGSADGVWHNENVSIRCSARDDESGLADAADASFSLSTNVAAGSEDANAATNSRQVCDVAGNCATAGPISGNQIDRKAPSITISVPTNATYLLNQAVAASYACADGGSGVASCAGPVANGSTIDTASVGAKNFTVNASDNVRNSAQQAVAYKVTYAFSGMLHPIDTKVPNTAKAGQIIPVKWRLIDANGQPISDPASFVSVTSSATSSACSGTPDAVEEYAGSSGLQYLGDGYWQYNWKTPRSYAGQCRTMSLTLQDGSAYTAAFIFK